MDVEQLGGCLLCGAVQIFVAVEHFFLRRVKYQAAGSVQASYFHHIVNVFQPAVSLLYHHSSSRHTAFGCVSCPVYFC